jgi:hypothetical protein
MTIILGSLAISTIVLVLLRKRLNTLIQIKKISKIYNMATCFTVIILCFQSLNLEEWGQALCVVLVLLGVQRGIILSAKERFFDFVLEHGKEFSFIPVIKIEDGQYEGVLTLPDNEDVAIRVTCVSEREIDFDTVYLNVPVYISMDFAGNPKNVFCSI